MLADYSTHADKSNIKRLKLSVEVLLRNSRRPIFENQSDNSVFKSIEKLIYKARTANETLNGEISAGCSRINELLSKDPDNATKRSFCGFLQNIVLAMNCLGVHSVSNSKYNHH
jgi:hypothetical protein